MSKCIINCDFEFLYRFSPGATQNATRRAEKPGQAGNDSYDSIYLGAPKMMMRCLCVCVCGAYAEWAGIALLYIVHSTNGIQFLIWPAAKNIIISIQMVKSPQLTRGAYIVRRLGDALLSACPLPIIIITICISTRGHSVYYVMLIRRRYIVSIDCVWWVYLYVLFRFFFEA